MRLSFQADRLVMTVDAAEQAELKALFDEDEDRFHKDDVMEDLFEPLVCNSEFEWGVEGITSDLTSGPMLVISGREERAKKRCSGSLEDFYGTGRFPVGAWDGFIWCKPILFRWVFMDYAVTSPQVELAKHGRAVWLGGAYLERPGNYQPQDFDCSLRVPQLS